MSSVSRTITEAAPKRGRVRFGLVGSFEVAAALAEGLLESILQVAPAQAQAYIHNPLAEFQNKRSGGPNIARLFSTHPSTEDRIARLRAMTF